MVLNCRPDFGYTVIIEMVYNWTWNEQWWTMEDFMVVHWISNLELFETDRLGWVWTCVERTLDPCWGPLDLDPSLNPTRSKLHGSMDPWIPAWSLNIVRKIWKIGQLIKALQFVKLATETMAVTDVYVSLIPGVVNPLKKRSGNPLDLTWGRWTVCCSPSSVATRALWQLVNGGWVAGRIMVK